MYILHQLRTRSLPIARCYLQETLSSLGGLEQLNRISVRILHLNLPAPGTGFHLIAKTHALILEVTNEGRQILHLEDHPVPSARLLLAAIWHQPRARRPRAAEDQFETAD